MIQNSLVLLTDFGTRERFVASMKGVAISVSPELRIFDLTHEIEPYNIREATYTLAHTISYWPEGTVFVAVVDPGVGTSRRSVVAKTDTGHYVVCPENGILSEVRKLYGIDTVREIDEQLHRLPGSDKYHTFHGRDIYVLTGARLAAGVITFPEVGEVYEEDLIGLNLNTVHMDGNEIIGTITKVEDPYGNIVTNIVPHFLEDNGINFGDTVSIKITLEGKTCFKKDLQYVRSFGYKHAGEPLIYPDSSHHIGLAVNGASFASMYDIHSGRDYEIRIGIGD